MQFFGIHAGFGGYSAVVFAWIFSYMLFSSEPIQFPVAFVTIYNWDPLSLQLLHLWSEKSEGSEAEKWPLKRTSRSRPLKRCFFHLLTIESHRTMATVVVMKELVISFFKIKFPIEFCQVSVFFFNLVGDHLSTLGSGYPGAPVKERTEMESWRDPELKDWNGTNDFLEKNDIYWLTCFDMSICFSLSLSLHIAVSGHHAISTHPCFSFQKPELSAKSTNGNLPRCSNSKLNRGGTLLLCGTFGQITPHRSVGRRCFFFFFWSLGVGKYLGVSWRWIKTGEEMGSLKSQSRHYFFNFCETSFIINRTPKKVAVS